MKNLLVSPNSHPTCSVFSPYWTLPLPNSSVDVSGMFFSSSSFPREVVLVAHRQPDSWWRFAFRHDPESLAPICRPLVSLPLFLCLFHQRQCVFTLVSLFLFSLRPSLRTPVMFSPPSVFFFSSSPFLPPLTLRTVLCSV